MSRSTDIAQTNSSILNYFLINEFDPSDTKGFGTYNKHRGGGGVVETDPNYLKNDKCYVTETLKPILQGFEKF